MADVHERAEPGAADVLAACPCGAGAMEGLPARAHLSGSWAGLQLQLDMLLVVTNPYTPLLVQSRVVHYVANDMLVCLCGVGSSQTPSC